MSLGAVFTAGLLPGVGGGVSLRGEITPPNLFPIEFGSAIWLDAHAASEAKGSTLSLSYGLLSACPLVWAAVLEPCMARLAPARSASSTRPGI